MEKSQLKNLLQVILEMPKPIGAAKFKLPMLHNMNINPFLTEKDFDEILDELWEQTFGITWNQNGFEEFMQNILWQGTGYYVPVLNTMIGTKPQNQGQDYSPRNDRHFKSFVSQLYGNFKQVNEWIKKVKEKLGSEHIEYGLMWNEGDEGLKIMQQPYLKLIEKRLKQLETANK